MTHTSPYTWALAALLCALLVLPAAAAAQSGGLAAPSPDSGAEPVDPEFRISARRGVYLGRTMRVKGSAPQAAGREVRVEWLDPAGAWQHAATVRADADGAFATKWEPEHVGRFKLRAVLEGASSSQAQHARASEPRTLTVYRFSKASWYGPGFYGNRTACGQRLRRNTVGVAHRRLKCGTRVAVRYGRKSTVVRVIDRGPYVRGVHWDLTAAAAKRLGVEHTTRIGAAPLG